MARLARLRRLVIGVVVATFVVPVAIVVGVELATRSGHDELRERVGGAVAAIAGAPDPARALPVLANQFAVDAWLVDPEAARVVATTRAMPLESDLGFGTSSAGFGSLTGSAAGLHDAFVAGRVEPWQREAVVRARERGATESCATVEPDAVAGGIYGDTLWSCEAARRRGDGLVVLVEASAPRATSRLVDVRGPLLVLAGIVIAVGALATAWLVRRLARPLDALHGRVRALAEVPRPASVPAVGAAPREIVEVAAAVDSLVARLDAAREAQAEAAADLAHELKGPLARIKVALDDGDAAHDPAREAVRAIDRIVVELLEIARIEAGLPEAAREEVALDELVRGVAAARGLDGLRVDGARRAVVAAEPVGRAIGHLLDNARAFGGELRVAIEAGAIVVIDDGPGVEVALVPRLFRRFASHRAGGTGLGLAYVRAVAEAHGGRATYARAADGTTRFAIHI